MNGMTKLELNMFDDVEYHFNVDVQILKNNVTGEYSIGWARPGSEVSEQWRRNAEEVNNENY